MPCLFTGSSQIITVTDPNTGQLVQQIVQTHIDPNTGEVKQVLNPLSASTAVNNTGIHITFTLFSVT